MRKAVGLPDFVEHPHTRRQGCDAAPTQQKFGVGIGVVRGIVARVRALTRQLREGLAQQGVVFGQQAQTADRRHAFGKQYGAQQALQIGQGKGIFQRETRLVRVCDARQLGLTFHHVALRKF